MPSFLRFFAPLSLCLLCMTSSVWAYWEDPSDAATQCEHHSTINVNADGTYTEETSRAITILTEIGRGRYQVHRMTFNAARSNLEVLKAFTTIGDDRFDLPLEKIETKPLASDPLKIRHEMQVLIPFSHVDIGATLHWTFRRTLKCFDAPGCFDYHIKASLEERLHKLSLRMTSPIPLRYKVNDPTDAFSVTHTKENSQDNLVIENTAPLYSTMTGEAPYMHQPLSSVPALLVITDGYMEHFGKHIGKVYEEIINEDTPVLLAELIAKAKTLATEEEKMDSLMVGLISSIHYLGSLNTADGGWKPRSLKAITASTYGDCKENAVLLVHALRALGIKSHVCFVKREQPFSSFGLPPEFFCHTNHAIVKAVSESGKTYWLDPTNTVAMSCGIFDDIAGRPCCVCTPQGFVYDHIPSNDPTLAQSYLKQIFKKTHTATVMHVDTHVRHQGHVAKTLSVGSTYHPPALIKHYIMQNLDRSGYNTTVTLEGLQERRVVPYKGSAAYDTKNALSLFSNYGPAFSLDKEDAKRYINVHPSDVGDLYTQEPETQHTRYILKKMTAKNTDVFCFDIATPWLHAKRTIEQTEAGLEIKVFFRVLKSMITNKELKSETYKNLQDVLKKQFSNTVLILEDLPSKKVSEV